MSKSFSKVPKGGGSSETKISVQKERETETAGVGADLILLRHAIRDDMGVDRDVLKEFAAIAKYNKNELNIKMEFEVCPLPRPVFNTAFRLCKTHLQDLWDVSGYGWDDEEKREELKDRACRFIVFRNVADESMAGFVSFKFSLSGEVVDEMDGEPALFVNDIHIAQAQQRKGLGKHVMMILELIAKRNHMSQIIIPVVKGNPMAEAFFQNKLKGFKVDETYGEDDQQMILSKRLLEKRAVLAEVDEAEANGQQAGEQQEGGGDAGKAVDEILASRLASLVALSAEEAAAAPEADKENANS